MLKRLRLFNILLIEEADISFNKGLNILTGETGAGKSAVIEGLMLSLGRRSGNTLLRHATSRGFVEAVFDIEKVIEVHDFLKNSGIAHEAKEYLVIRREIHTSGKNLSFVNNCLVQLPILQKIGSYLIDVVGQDSHQNFKSLDYHRQSLDQYGSLQDPLKTIERKYKSCKTLEKKLKELSKQESERLKNIEIHQEKITEIKTANLQLGEEEELFKEFTRLSNIEELSDCSNTIYKELIEDKSSILPSLSKHLNILERLSSLDPSLEDLKEAVKNICIELQEIAYTLCSYRKSAYRDPDKLSTLHERLQLIEKLKNKYGDNIENVLSYLENKERDVKILKNFDYEIENLHSNLSREKETYDRLYEKLTEKRRRIAKSFEQSMTKEIRSLNMPTASFRVSISKRSIKRFDNDLIEFLLYPNKGEKIVSLQNCASGGELSRAMLALKTVLAGQEKTPTLFFDEIDGNIGGETASIVGKKLKIIGKNHQVLCITHLPQIAKEADNHLKISKEERNKRTISSIASLSLHERKTEIARMLGGESLAGNSTKAFAEKILLDKR